MFFTIDAQRFTFNARYAMPVSYHSVWCDRAFCVVGGSITSELYVKCVECRRRSGTRLTLALQAALRPINTMGMRGANSTRRDDCTSQRENLQNTFLEGYRGIACLADCSDWLRPISIGDRWAYARHTPYATRQRLIHTYYSGWCAWLRVLRLAVGVSWASGNKKIPFKWGRGGPCA